MMFINHSNIQTYKTSEDWNTLEYDQKLNAINDILKKNNYFEIIEIKKLINNDQIIAALKKNFTASERGMILLDIEHEIKTNLDNGLNLWLEPLGDKNSLRNLRGINITNE